MILLIFYPSKINILVENKVKKQDLIKFANSLIISKWFLHYRVFPQDKSKNPYFNRLFLALSLI